MQHGAWIQPPGEGDKCSFSIPDNPRLAEGGTELVGTVPHKAGPGIQREAYLNTFSTKANNFQAFLP